MSMKTRIRLANGVTIVDCPGRLVLGEECVVVTR
jgi:hypothetical protein